MCKSHVSTTMKNGNWISIYRFMFFIFSSHRFLYVFSFFRRIAMLVWIKIFFWKSNVLGFTIKLNRLDFLNLDAVCIWIFELGFGLFLSNRTVDPLFAYVRNGARKFQLINGQWFRFTPIQLILVARTLVVIEKECWSQWVWLWFFLAAAKIEI